MSGTRSLLRRVNLRHLRERKLRTALTVAGIASGVALVFSVSIINATLSSSFSTSLRALAGVADVEVSAADASGLPDSALATIKQVDGVDRAVPALRTVTQVRGPKGSARSLLLGITPEFPTLYGRSGGAPPDVKLNGDFGDGSGIVLSQQVASEIGVRIGDSVRLTTPRGLASVAVTGTVTGDGVPAIQGGRMGVMTLDAARGLLDRSGRLDFVWVTVESDTSITEVERRIGSSLGGAAVVGRPGERARGFQRAIGAVGTMTSLAGTAALFVSLFVVYNAMSISLMERRRELAMALALGGSRRQLFGASLGEAAVLGAMSSAVGMGFGYAMARLLYDGFADQARILGVAPGGAVVVRPSHLAVAFLGGLIVAIAGAFVPARRILRVAPIESLRPEAALEWTTPRTRRRARLSLAAGLVTFALGAGGGVLAAQFPDAIWPFTTAILFLLAGASMLLPHVVPAVVRLLRGTLLRFGTVGRLASDALQKNSSRTTLTVGTLVLTASLLVAINSSFGSYGIKIRESAHLWYGAPLYVTSDSFTGFVSDQPLPASLAERIEEVDGVRAAYPMRYVSLDVGGEQMVIYALPVARAAREGMTNTLSAADGVDQRTFLSVHGRGEIAIARFTAEQRGLKVGDSFAIPTPAGTREFRVGAISNDLNGFESASMEYDTYASFWKADSADQFYVLTDPGVSDSVVERRIDAMLRSEGVPAYVRAREGAIDDLVDTVLSLLSLAQLIGLAALIVAAITIANTMFTAVLERRWEFGLQRAVGMGKRQLGRSVLLEASVIGALGGAGAVLLGAGMGFLMIQGMRAGFAWQIPFRPPASLLVLVVLGGAALAAAAGSYPRRLAVRTPIIEALRYE